MLERYVCNYILGTSEAASKEDFMAKFVNAMSAGFDPDVHLKKIGIANQTTMYKKETSAIGKLFEKTMITLFGPEEADERFAAFDTICDATQERQDAIMDMVEDPAVAELDFILVVGGFDSSNTAHLVEIPHNRNIPVFHINEASCIGPDNSVTHRQIDGTYVLFLSRTLYNSIVTDQNFLNLGRPVKIGVTSGASTCVLSFLHEKIRPDAYVQECLEAIVFIKAINTPVNA